MKPERTFRAAPAGSDDDFVEFRNTGDREVDLSEWALNRPWRILADGLQNRYTTADDHFTPNIALQYPKRLTTAALSLLSIAAPPDPSLPAHPARWCTDAVMQTPCVPRSRFGVVLRRGGSRTHGDRRGRDGDPDSIPEFDVI
ncbi:hypothetical protein BH10ACT5_BH10ACT5_03090 [soil metagenome]